MGEVPSVIQVCLGEDEGDFLAREVLRGSILRRASLPVKFIEFSDIPIPSEISPEYRDSFLRLRRFLLPQVLGFKGKVIYLDGLSIVLSDIFQLWQTPFHGKGALARKVDMNKVEGAERYTGVMLLDNEKLSNWSFPVILDAFRKNKDLFKAILWNRVDSPFFEDFGDLEKEFLETEKVDQETKIFNPLIQRKHPMKDLNNPGSQFFIDELKASLEAKEISPWMVIEEVKLGNVSKDLLTFL